MIFVCPNCKRRRKLRLHKYSKGHSRCRVCRFPIFPDYFATSVQGMQRFCRAVAAATVSAREFGDAVRAAFELPEVS